MKTKTIPGLALALFIAGFYAPRCPAAETAASLLREAYVWQRDWNQPVREAVAEHGSDFNGLVALKAEVSWRENQPHVIRVPIDFTLLNKTNTGLALRIGPYAGPFLPADKTTTYLTTLAGALIAEAKSAGCLPRELQIDFDCAGAKLDGYRVWVEAIRRKIKPVPLTITALPSWLDEPSFAGLVVATDGYVLQVHSLEPPSDANTPFTLCNPPAAQRAVERAGKIAVPFRVALPTYGYTVAFDRQGKFIGLTAEGPGRNWPAGAEEREVRSNPTEMAQLVRSWTTNHPAAMRGIIWYRLPVAGDSLNLRWPTMAAIMTGATPHEHVRVETRRVEPGLVEISLVNDGELDVSSPLAVEVRWQNARLMAGDGVHGFELADSKPSAVQFEDSRQPVRLPAGENEIIGWLRLNEEREVQGEISKL